MTSSPERPRFGSVAEAAAHARQILAEASPRAAAVIRQRSAEQRQGRNEQDARRWADIETRAAAAIEHAPRLQESWMPPIDDEQADARQRNLARARARARQERAQRLIQ
ncbi:hypothetical protein GCM10010156_49090 [Planobispora rosea]|uniref:Uncharacterized protein n=1 Tax=Planobispora rosea TaxID=35762 RepID=A0A8J3WEI3_PLARO|nr:hypothetical protein [Planobispora rosea]GGS84636.1 hypothetical protein GCM10010156_49090 [Planobispora rosea]GIH86420.1 hypothetical protein Pro02_48280 [Planobispora rosea]